MHQTPVPEPPLTCVPVPPLPRPDQCLFLKRSGTVGAARTAGLYGVPALASSSTSLDKSTALDNAVDATLVRDPARGWARRAGGGRCARGGRKEGRTESTVSWAHACHPLLAAARRSAGSSPPLRCLLAHHTQRLACTQTPQPKPPMLPPPTHPPNHYRQTLTEMALSTLEGRPARNWPRNHIVTGGLGRRHVHSSCDYEALPQNWVMDVEQVCACAAAHRKACEGD